MDIELEVNRQPLQLNSTSWIMLLGAGLGFLADRLFGSVGPFALGFLIWTSLFAIALVWLTRICNGSSSRPVAIWSMVAVCAATLMLFRAVPIIVLGLLLVMAVAMAMIMFHLAGRSFLESRLAELVGAVFSVPIQGGTGAWPLLGYLDFGAGLKHPGLWSGLRGALLAIPLLLIFIGLFSSADASFNQLVEDFFNVFSAETIRHVLLTLLFAWLTTGLLASVPGSRRFAERKPTSLLRLGSIDTAVLMGSLVALFLVFVVMQLGYLFGGRETIEVTSGLTLAQYARRGFFELLMVAGLTLIVLVSIAGSGCNQRIFRPLATALIGCVLIIQVSAVQRLLLYIEEFGLTIDRVTALAVLIWVVGGIVLFSGTLLRGQTRLFAAGMTISGVVVVFLLAAVNPGGLVTEVNIKRSIDNQRSLDIGHLLMLGSDAVPALVENLEQVPVPQRCEPVAYLYSQWYGEGVTALGEETDWREWTHSRYRAARLIDLYEERLKELASTCLVGGLVIDFLGRPRLEVFVHGRRIDTTRLIRWATSS